jgi:hypothetical protein
VTNREYRAGGQESGNWILTPPAKLADDHRTKLAGITARCEELKTARGLVRDFADMLCHRHGEHLEAWATQAETSPSRAEMWPSCWSTGDQQCAAQWLCGPGRAGDSIRSCRRGGGHYW